MDKGVDTAETSKEILPGADGFSHTHIDTDSGVHRFAMTLEPIGSENPTVLEVILGNGSVSQGAHREGPTAEFREIPVNEGSSAADYIGLPGEKGQDINDYFMAMEEDPNRMNLPDTKMDEVAALAGNYPEFAGELMPIMARSYVELKKRMQEKAAKEGADSEFPEWGSDEITTEITDFMYKAFASNDELYNALHLGFLRRDLAGRLNSEEAVKALRELHS